MHGIKLFRLMLRDLKHLHSQDAETVFLKLLDDVADRVLGDRVRFDNSKSTLQSLHSWVVCPRSLVLGRWSLVVGPWSLVLGLLLSRLRFPLTLSPPHPLLLRRFRRFRRVIWRRGCRPLPLL